MFHVELTIYSMTPRIADEMGHEVTSAWRAAA